MADDSHVEIVTFSFPEAVRHVTPSFSPLGGRDKWQPVVCVCVFAWVCGPGLLVGTPPSSRPSWTLLMEVGVEARRNQHERHADARGERD